MTGDGKTSGKATWGDVMAASAEVEAAQAEADAEPVEAVPVEAEAPRAQPTRDQGVPAAAEPEQPLRPGEKLRPGDTVRHPKFGDCTVHRITENCQFVHMAVPNGKVRRLSMAIVEFTFDGIEGGRRIFRTRVKNNS